MSPSDRVPPTARTVVVTPSAAHPGNRGQQGHRRRVERATGIEPATSCLGSKHSTTELRPRELELPIGVEPTSPGWQPRILTIGLWKRRVVGAQGFQPWTFRSQSGRAKQAALSPEGTVPDLAGRLPPRLLGTRGLFSRRPWGQGVGAEGGNRTPRLVRASGLRPVGHHHWIRPRHCAANGAPARGRTGKTMRLSHRCMPGFRHAHIYLVLRQLRA